MILIEQDPKSYSKQDLQKEEEKFEEFKDAREAAMIQCYKPDNTEKWFTDWDVPNVYGLTIYKAMFCLYHSNLSLLLLCSLCPECVHFLFCLSCPRKEGRIFHRIWGKETLNTCCNLQIWGIRMLRLIPFARLLRRRL